MSAARRGNRRLDDAGAEPLEVGDPRLGRVARLGLAAVAEVGRLSEQPDREPVEARLGHRPAGQHRPEQRDVRHRPPHRPDRVERRAEREDAVERQRAPAATSARPCRTRPTGAGSSSPCRCRARGRRARPRAPPRCRPTSRRSSCPGWSGLCTVPYHGFAPSTLHANSGRLRLADDDGAGVERALDDGRVDVRDVVGVDPRAVRRADAGRVDQVLDEQRPPGERPLGGAAQRLVEPGDRGVVGSAAGRGFSLVLTGSAHAGTSATHSTSIFAPGITSAEISTSVEAGRVSPNTSCRTGLTSGRSFTSVR